MSKLQIIKVDKNKIYSVIKKHIYDCRIPSSTLSDTKFYHNTLIENIPYILKNGLLSKERQSMVERRKMTDEEIFRGSDENKVNGLSFISLSSMDVDFSKMHKSEDYYDPFEGIQTSIIISNKVKAMHITKNYFNEF